MDLENCFHVVPLHPDDGKECLKRYHWKVLSQGMANSFTLCEKKNFFSSLFQYKKLGL